MVATSLQPLLWGSHPGQDRFLRRTAIYFSANQLEVVRWNFPIPRYLWGEPEFNSDRLPNAPPSSGFCRQLSPGLLEWGSPQAKAAPLPGEDWEQGLGRGNGGRRCTATEPLSGAAGGRGVGFPPATGWGRPRCTYIRLVGLRVQPSPPRIKLGHTIRGLPLAALDRPSRRQLTARERWETPPTLGGGGTLLPPRRWRVGVTAAHADTFGCCGSLASHSKAARGFLL